MGLHRIVVTRLSSGYWRVGFGPQVFVQWPVGTIPAAEHVFHGGEDAERYAREAAECVDGGPHVGEGGE